MIGPEMRREIHRLAKSRVEFWRAHYEHLADRIYRSGRSYSWRRLNSHLALMGSWSEVHAAEYLLVFVGPPRRQRGFLCPAHAQRQWVRGRDAMNKAAYAGRLLECAARATAVHEAYFVLRGKEFYGSDGRIVAERYRKASAK